MTRNKRKQELVLAAGGEAKAVIRKPDSPELAPVARELQRCLDAATGASFPIAAAGPEQPRAELVLQIDPSLLNRYRRRALPARQAVGLRCDGRARLEIRGSDVESLWLSLYAFLEEQVGCRWFFPGKTGEDIPTRDRLALPKLDTVYTPSFIVRDFRFWPEDFQRRKLAGGFSFGSAHSYAAMVPAAELEKHPEYGVMIGGRRRPEAGFQRCLAQKGVEDLAVRYCLDYFASNPDAVSVGLSPNDCEVFCDCPGCVRASLGRSPRKAEKGKSPWWVTRSVFGFANRVAARVAEVHPDKLICVIAYSRMKSPVPGTEVHPNVLVWYCDQPQINWQGAEGRAIMDSEIREWGRLAKHLGVYDYVVNQSWPGLVRPVTEILAHEIKLVHACGGRYYYTQHGDDFGVNLPNYYLCASLLWDVDRDPDAVLDDMYARCFRRAAEHVKTYYTLLEEAVATAASTGLGPNAIGITGHYRSHESICAIYTPDVLEKARAAIAGARSAAAGDPVARRRLKLVVDAHRFLEGSVAAARRTWEFEMRYRIPPLTPWAWNVGNYDYHSAVEKLEMFDRPCVDELRAIIDDWAACRALRERLEKTHALGGRFTHGASFNSHDTLQNILGLYTGEIEEVPRRVVAKSILRAM